MATRQELFTAIGLIRQICRVNRHIVGFPAALDRPLDDKPTEPDAISETFEDRKELLLKISHAVENISGNIGVVLQKADPKYLNNGIDAIPVSATRPKITSDADNSKTLLMDTRSFIETATKIEDFSLLSASLDYTSECGTVEPDPWKLFPVEVNHANILHDILDAMSYELQGRNSYTGELHGMTLIELRKLVKNRLFTGWIYHQKLTDDPEPVGYPNRAKMGDVLRYIENWYDEIADLKTLGQYIDSEIPKHIIVRRWWAL